MKLTMIVQVLFALVVSVVSASAQGNYLIQPGDRLAIEVLEDTSLNRQALVLPDGRFSFPLAGSVAAGGMTTDQVQRAIAGRIAGNFAVEPTVFVSIVGLAPTQEGIGDGDIITVYLMGEVLAPGAKPVETGTTLLQALSQSGGFSPFAATKRLQLRRLDPKSGQQRLYKINYKAIARGAQMSQDPVLRDGDVIIVPERRLFE
ncbi:polysaccharide biosynthesis/export family protein [Tropicimonas sp.]|uniref:polysaccharide biosynthesis/export family protein n=1 Tax=Tropicimonas sp. TaxID=2067044 RepID=UPI003A89F331